MLSPLPRHSNWRSRLAHPSSHISLPRKGRRVGLCIVVFEASSAFTHVTACTLVLPPNFVARYIEGFSHFVTSVTAPITCRLEHFAGWAFHPLESAAFARRTPEADLPVFEKQTFERFPSLACSAIRVVGCLPMRTDIRRCRNATDGRLWPPRVDLHQKSTDGNRLDQNALFT